MRVSRCAWSSLATWYSAFSLRSPSSRAVLIRAAIALRRGPSRSASSALRSSRPCSVIGSRDCSFPMPARLVEPPCPWDRIGLRFSHVHLLRPHRLDPGRPPSARSRRLRGVPGTRHALGPSAHVPVLRPHRLLRRLAREACDGAPRADRAPDHPLGRAGGRLELVLRGRGHVPPRALAAGGDRQAGGGAIGLSVLGP